MISHKDSAVDFLKKISQGNIREAFSTYAAPQFIHHNPRFKSDAESLMKAMEESHSVFPNRIYEVKHAIEEKELVAVHGRVKLSDTRPYLMLVHIFRFEKGKIVEMWDIGEEVPADSPNENGMF